MVKKTPKGKNELKHKSKHMGEAMAHAGPLSHTLRRHALETCP